MSHVLPQRIPFPSTHTCRTLPPPVLRRFAEALAAWNRDTSTPPAVTADRESTMTLAEALAMIDRSGEPSARTRTV